MNLNVKEINVPSPQCSLAAADARILAEESSASLTKEVLVQKKKRFHLLLSPASLASSLCLLCSSHRREGRHYWPLLEERR